MLESNTWLVLERNWLVLARVATYTSATPSDGGVREMSSLLVFEYDGNDRARCGTQRGRPGDDVYDDELGKGVLEKGRRRFRSR